MSHTFYCQYNQTLMCKLFSEVILKNLRYYGAALWLVSHTVVQLRVWLVRSVRESLALPHLEQRKTVYGLLVWFAAFHVCLLVLDCSAKCSFELDKSCSDCSDILLADRSEAVTCQVLRFANRTFMSHLVTCL